MDLRSFFSGVALSDRRRLYRLQGAASFEHLHVERWCGSAALSSCYEYHIDTLAADAALPLDAFLGKPVSLLTTLADGATCSRSGLVREAACLGSDGSMTRYRLTLVPWLWVLGEGRRSRVFQEKTVLDIVEDVLADYSDYAAWEATPEVATWLEGVRPRSYAVQYRESDLQFIERLLAEEGLGYCFIEETDAPAGHKLRIFADSAQLPEEAGSATTGQGIRYQGTAAVEESDGIQQLAPHAVLTASHVTLLTQDYKTHAATGVSLPVNSPHTTGEHYVLAGAYAFSDSREGAHYATVAAQTLEAQQATWQGLSTWRGAREGQRFRVANTSWRNAKQTLPNAFLWTTLHEAGVNNLPESLATSVPALPLADDALWQQAKRTGYAQQFSALDAAIPFRPARQDQHGNWLHPKATVSGAQTALVVGPHGETEPSEAGAVHMDKLGRIKVRFHWMEAGASCWLRVVQRYAGAGFGAQFLPRIGQEVLVNFLDNDIDRPIVMGALYNGQGEGGIAPTPGAVEAASAGELFSQAADFQPSAQGNLVGGNSPAWHGQSPEAEGHHNAAALSGIKTEGLDGHGHNQLVFDDTDGQGRVQLASSHASSQLNMGHLIHQADNYRGSFRGLGFELRTDAYGAVRGEAGVLLSTYAQPSDEPVGDATGASALLKHHEQLANSLSQASQQHQGVGLAGVEGSQANGQSRLDNQVAPLSALAQHQAGRVTGTDYTQQASTTERESVPHSTAPLVTLSARGSLVATAGGPMAFAVGETLNLGSGEHTSLAAGEHLRLHSGQALGITAGTQGATGVGIHVGAAKGPVQIEAQHGALTFASDDDLQVISNTQLNLAAADSIKLATAGGAYIEIKDGNITFGCPGQLTVEASAHQLGPAVGLSTKLPIFPDSICVECLMKRAANRGGLVSKNP